MSVRRHVGEVKRSMKETPELRDLATETLATSLRAIMFLYYREVSKGWELISQEIIKLEKITRTIRGNLLYTPLFLLSLRIYFAHCFTNCPENTGVDLHSEAEALTSQIVFDPVQR